ncbi:MAG: hypothetical protein IPK82_31405 [Polyangiaceae bacterium]|nr:hypothetical protein [Polyangiaceae bacterium]
MELSATAGRTVLVVPEKHVDAVLRQFRADADALREQTEDDLWIDVASIELPKKVFCEAGAHLFDKHHGDWIREVEIEKHRRATRKPRSFWDPMEPHTEKADGAVSGIEELARSLRSPAQPAGAICVTEGSGTLPLGIHVEVGDSASRFKNGAHSRLVLQTDGREPDIKSTPEMEVARLPLAGAWVERAYNQERPDDLAPIDFDGLAERSEGDAKLGVVRMDFDNMGALFRRILEAKSGLQSIRDWLAFSDALRFACGPLADQVTLPARPVETESDGHERDAGPPPEPRGVNVQWVLSGGDDLFLVGGWWQVVETCKRLRDAVVLPLRKVFDEMQIVLPPSEKGGKPSELDLSAGLVIAHPKVPIAHLAEQAEDQIHCAKSRPKKGSIAWESVPMRWDDFGLVVELAHQTREAIKAQHVERSLLQKLASIHIARHRAEEVYTTLGSSLPSKEAVKSAAEAQKRVWVWAYELGRAEHSATQEGRALLKRLSGFALENKDICNSTSRDGSQEAALWIGLVGEIAHRATRSERKQRQ